MRPVALFQNIFTDMVEVIKEITQPEWLMSEHTQTWPELAIGLYEALTEKKAEITYHFEDMKVEIPSGTGPEAQHALWKLDGKLRISTKSTE